MRTKLLVFANLILIVLNVVTYSWMLSRITDTVSNETTDMRVEWFTIHIYRKGTGGGYISGVTFFNIPLMLFLVSIVLSLWLLLRKKRES